VLAVFALLGVALARMKRAGAPARGVYTVPAWVPYASTAAAITLIGLQVYDLIR